MDPLRIAVVGVGFWGRNHTRVLNELPGAELVAEVINDDLVLTIDRDSAAEIDKAE